VKSRSKPFQPYYEGGFPYGKEPVHLFVGQRLGGGALALGCEPRLAATR